MFYTLQSSNHLVASEFWRASRLNSDTKLQNNPLLKFEKPPFAHILVNLHHSKMNFARFNWTVAKKQYSEPLKDLLRVKYMMLENQCFSFNMLKYLNCGKRFLYLNFSAFFSASEDTECRRTFPVLDYFVSDIASCKFSVNCLETNGFVSFVSWNLFVQRL